MSDRREPAPGYSIPSWQLILQNQSYPRVGRIISIRARQSTSIDFFDLLPSAALGGFEDGVGYVVGGEAVFEGWAGDFATAQALDKVRHLMHKAVLVADLQARDPPFVHIRMIAIGDMERPPAAHPAFVLVIEVLQPMKVVQIPED